MKNIIISIVSLFFLNLCNSQNIAFIGLKEVVVGVKKPSKEIESILKKVKRNYNKQFDSENLFLYKANIVTLQDSLPFFNFEGSLFLKKKTTFSCDAVFFTNDFSIDRLGQELTKYSKKGFVAYSPNYFLPINIFEVQQFLATLTQKDFLKSYKNYHYKLIKTNDFLEISFTPITNCNFNFRGIIKISNTDFNILEININKDSDFIVYDYFYKSALFKVFKIKESLVHNFEIVIKFDKKNEKLILSHCYPKVLVNSQISFGISYKQVDLEKLS